MNQSQVPSVRLKWFGIPKLLPYLKPYRRNIIYMMLLGALGSVIDISIPLFQRYAINNYITKGVTHGILWFALLYALALGTQVLANFFCFYHSGKTEMYVGRDMKRMHRFLPRLHPGLQQVPRRLDDTGDCRGVHAVASLPRLGGDIQKP